MLVIKVPLCIAKAGERRVHIYGPGFFVCLFLGSGGGDVGVFVPTEQFRPLFSPITGELQSSGFLVHELELPS